MNNYDTLTDWNAMQEMLSALIVPIIILFAIYMVGLWRIFTKAGQPGWAAILPIYNLYIYVKITCGNLILFLLLFVPGVNVFVRIYTVYRLAKVFDKGIGFTLGLLLLPPIFSLILAFGSADYLGFDD